MYGASALLLLASLVMMWRVKRRPSRGVRSSVSWGAVLEGLYFVWRRKTVLGAISLDLFAVLFGGATALLPAFTQSVLHAGPEVFGVATLVFGLTRHFWVALIALMLLGAGDMVSVFIRQLLVQLETPDVIRGRVSAVNSVFIGASNELGEFESGITAAWLGLVPAIVVGGGVTLLVTGLWAWGLFPRLRRLQTFDQLKEGHANET